MVDAYPGTNVPFETYTLPDLHDPIVLGPGSDEMQSRSQLYSALAETFDTAVGDLRAVLAKSQHAQQGEAADAARQHVLKVVSAGEVGAEHARLATYALQEQAAHFSRARTDMQAAVDTVGKTQVPAHGTKGPSQIAVDASNAAGHTVAVDGAHLYQNNSNHNLTFIFQGFDPPQIAAPDVSAGPESQAPSWGGNHLGAGTSSVAPAGGGGAGPVAAAPPVGGPGAVPPSAGAPAAPVVPGLVPPTTAGSRAGGSSSGNAPAITPATRPGGGSAATPGGTAQPTPGGRTSPPSAPSPVTSARSRPTRARPGGAMPGSRAGASTSPNLDIPAPGVPGGGGSGWVPGQPWTTRPGAAGSGAQNPGSAAGPPGSGANGYRPGDPFGRGSGGGTEARPGSGCRTAIGHRSSGATRRRGARRPGGRHLVPILEHRPPARHADGWRGGRGQDTEDRRPSWPLEPDPEELWMSGLPPHGPAVIEPLED